MGLDRRRRGRGRRCNRRSSSSRCAPRAAHGDRARSVRGRRRIGVRVGPRLARRASRRGRAGDVARAWSTPTPARSGRFTDDNQYAAGQGRRLPGLRATRSARTAASSRTTPCPSRTSRSAATPQTASSMGKFNCTPGGSTATTTLAGPYVKVVDTLRTHLAVGDVRQRPRPVGQRRNRLRGPGGRKRGQHARRAHQLLSPATASPSTRGLAPQPHVADVSADRQRQHQSTSATRTGTSTSVNFFKSGGGCSNTGEIAGVFLHEWGHGLDENDGGGLDNPSEAYADITAFLSTHVSCMGRGFKQSGNVRRLRGRLPDLHRRARSGLGQAREPHPATPAGFVTTHCPERLGSVRQGSPLRVVRRRRGAVGSRRPATCRPRVSTWPPRGSSSTSSGTGRGWVRAGAPTTARLPSSDGCAAASWFQKLRDDRRRRRQPGQRHAARRRDLRRVRPAQDRLRRCGRRVQPDQHDLPGDRRHDARGDGRGGLRSAELDGSGRGHRVQRPPQRSLLLGRLRRSSPPFLGPRSPIRVLPRDSPSSTACSPWGRTRPATDASRIANPWRRNPRSARSSWMRSPTPAPRRSASPSTTPTSVPIRRRSRSRSTTEPAGETITLTRISPGSATYTGSHRTPPRPAQPTTG